MESCWIGALSIRSLVLSSHSFFGCSAKPSEFEERDMIQHVWGPFIYMNSHLLLYLSFFRFTVNRVCVKVSSSSIPTEVLLRLILACCSFGCYFAHWTCTIRDEKWSKRMRTLLSSLYFILFLFLLIVPFHLLVVYLLFCFSDVILYA